MATVETVAFANRMDRVYEKSYAFRIRPNNNDIIARRIKI